MDVDVVVDVDVNGRESEREREREREREGEGGEAQNVHDWLHHVHKGQWFFGLSVDVNLVAPRNILVHLLRKLVLFRHGVPHFKHCAVPSNQYREELHHCRQLVVVGTAVRHK